jgi:hypothetical protein
MDNWSRLEVVPLPAGIPPNPSSPAHCHEPLDARAIDARVVAPLGPAVRLLLIARPRSLRYQREPSLVMRTERRLSV